MADLPGLVGTALGIVTLVVALLIVVLARRSVAATALAVYLAALGAMKVQGSIIFALGGDEALVRAMIWVLHMVSAAGILAFAVVYPNLNVTPRRQAALATIVVGAIGVIATMLLLPDAWWYDPATERAVLPRFFAQMFGLLGTVLPMLIMGIRWLRWRPGPFRTQLVWGIMPLAWWMLHDGLGYFLYPLVLGELTMTESLFRGTTSSIMIAGTLFTFVLVVIACSRVMRGRGASDDRALGFVLLYFLPLTLLQVVFPWSTGPGIPPFAHILLDFAVVPLAVYGVLRHRVVDIDLKLKWGLTNSTVAGFFLAVFFVAATVAQEFLADSLGWLAGGAAAGLLILAIAPIQRIAQSLSAAAFPNVRDDSGYLTYRRYQIYQVALEGILKDGVVDPSEATALRSLRAELELTMEDHQALESNARSRMAALGA